MLRLNSLLASTLLVSGCVTMPKRQTPPPNKPQEQVQEKAGTDVPEEPAKDVVPVPSEAEQLAFLRKHARPSASFGEDEHKFVGALPDDPEPGSITEAALAIGLIKTVLHPLGYVAPSFEEQDLAGDEGSEPARGPSLAKLCDERGINLADALSENVLLASAGIATQALAAIERGPNPEEFKTDVRTAVARHANDWSEVTASLGIAPAIHEQPEQELAESPSESLPPNPADIKSGDALIMEAQALADKGDYRAAIDKVRLVPQDSPMYAVAQEKIQEFSNRGVQALRRKAARAFQNAMPITDAKVRAEYLEKAKEYLEEAISNYPDASQLPTVRDNLQIISRDLERLKSEIKGH